jgi:hypothetical protein
MRMTQQTRRSWQSSQLASWALRELDSCLEDPNPAYFEWRTRAVWDREDPSSLPSAAEVLAADSRIRNGLESKKRGIP